MPAALGVKLFPRSIFLYVFFFFFFLSFTVRWPTALRVANAVVKLPLEHRPALVAPIAFDTSAAETGQNTPV
jgi:hypothetical protein